VLGPWVYTVWALAVEAAAEAIAIARQTRWNAWETFMSHHSVVGKKRR